jgi:subtilisin family serine protease
MDEVCLSIRFTRRIVEQLQAVAKGDVIDRPTHTRELLREVFAFVQGLDFHVTATGAATMCIRGTPAQFRNAFDTMPPLDGWSARGFNVVDQNALDRVARKLPGLIEDIALQRAFLETSVGSWPPPPPTAGCLSLLDQVPKLLRADLVHAKPVDGAGVRVMVFESDFAFDHRYFAERQADCKELLAVSTQAPGVEPVSGHGTAMAALILAVAPRAQVIGMKLRNRVLLEGIETALAMGEAERPHIFSISLTQDMCDRDEHNSGTCWTRLPRDFEHIGDELALAVAQGITVVSGSGNGQYGFPAAMKQVIAVGGAEVDPSQVEPTKVWSEGSAFSSKITEGDCADRFVPDICGLAGGNRGAYIVLPVPPGSEYEQEFPLSPALPAGSGWALFSGTSAATAQVAGVCALILQQRPDLEPRHLRNLLRNTARDVAEGKASRFSNLPAGEGLAATGNRDNSDGFGLVDAFEAVQSVSVAAAIGPPHPR